MLMMLYQSLFSGPKFDSVTETELPLVNHIASIRLSRLCSFKYSVITSCFESFQADSEMVLKTVVMPWPSFLRAIRRVAKTIVT